MRISDWSSDVCSSDLQRELAWRLGVTVGTVTRAYDLAAQRGLLSGEVGRGTFVRDRRTPENETLLPPPADAPVNLGTNVATIAQQATALGTSLAELAGCSGSRSEEHTSELQSLMRISYAVFCLKKKNQ